jgi:hypothetical protein
MTAWEFDKGACCLYCRKHVCECSRTALPTAGIPITFSDFVPKNEIWLFANGRIEITRFCDEINEADRRNRQRIW